MAVDLTKLILHTGYPSFHNDDVYTSSFAISGTMTPGINTRTHDVTVGDGFTIADAMFQGRSAGTDPRPTNAWFRHGAIWTFVAFDGLDYQWFVTYQITSSTNLRVTVYSNNPYTSNITADSATLSIRVYNYRSV